MAVSINGQSHAASAGWLKTGKASAQAAKQAEAEQQKRKEEQGKMWRFFLKPGEEASVTFVDGDLSPEGFLLPPRFYEHNIYLNGTWGNLFVCPEKSGDGSDKCPLCEDPKEHPTLVALFTIIDHRQWTKDDKTFKDQPRLYVANSGTFEVLNKLATKLGGLAGQTLDISRTKGDKTPRVGDVFVPMKKRTIAECQDEYQREKVDPKTNKKEKVTFFVPANYETEIVYRSGDELRKLGLGKPVHAAPAAGYTSEPGQSKEDYASNL